MTVGSFPGDSGLTLFPPILLRKVFLASDCNFSPSDSAYTSFVADLAGNRKLP